MKIFLPDNYIFHLLSDSLPIMVSKEIIFQPSSLISKAINETESAVGFIPTFDLLIHKNLFVSSKFGVGFEGQLSTTYLYFKPEVKNISELLLSGDISSLEPIIAKILFRELYGSEITVRIETDLQSLKDQNAMICGNFNFSSSKYQQGISLSEEITDFLGLPFVNYLLASDDENLLNSFQNSLIGISDEIYSSVEEDSAYLPFDAAANEFIKSNISSVIFDFEQNDLDGISHLLLLPYYHGIIKEIVEMKLI